MTVESQINESSRYLGSGTYRALSPVITAAGRAAGWVYSYPIGINLNGVNYTQTGETLDSLLAKGFIELREQNRTAF